MALYKLYFFCSGMKFKMAATAGLSLTLNPMGKMFQKPNCHKVSVFYANRKSMAATAGHRLTLDPMGKYSKCLLLRNYKYD